MECYFTEPAAMPHNIIISLKEGERPLDKRGALRAIIPEEARHAMMAAIARDISNGVESEVLEEWRHKALSCTATFQVHASEAERCRVAMQLRENLANDHETMSRTQLQRVYEIVFSVTSTLRPTGGARPLLPTSPPNTEKRAWPRVAKESASPLWTPR